MSKKHSNNTTTTLKKDDITTIDIHSLAYGGQGVHKGDGLVLFVPRGLPGDTLKVRIKKIKKRYGSADIVEVVKPSPHRIASPCPSFDAGCGGCQWLQLDYKIQLEWKTRIVRETFQHLGKLNVKVADTIGMKNRERCRNKLSLHRNREGVTGLMKEQSHDIIPFIDCMQEMEPVEKACQTLLKSTLPEKVSQVHIRSTPEGEVNICLFAPRVDKKDTDLITKLHKSIPGLSGVSVATFGGYVKSVGKPGLTVVIGGIKYFVPATGFFQTNYEQAERLLKLVHKLADPQPADTILDLYCGVGFFTLDLARKCSQITGLEGSSDAVKAAQKNTRINGIENAQFKGGDARNAVAYLTEESFDTVILDPARGGCDPEVITKIIDLNPSKIIYVSCAPDTQVRDIKPLIEAGYTIDICQPLDMFPNTYHVENVIRLVK